MKDDDDDDDDDDPMMIKMDVRGCLVRRLMGVSSGEGAVRGFSCILQGARRGIEAVLGERGGLKGAMYAFVFVLPRLIAPRT